MLLNTEVISVASEAVGKGQVHKSKMAWTVLGVWGRDEISAQASLVTELARLASRVGSSLKRRLATPIIVQNRNGDWS